MKEPSPQTRTRLPVSGSSGLLTPGPRFLAMYLLALPPAVVALSASGLTQQVSGFVAIAWFALAPLALYRRRALTALPIVALTSLVATVAFLPFNSGPFWANACTTAAMFLATLPRRSAPQAREMVRTT